VLGILVAVSSIGTTTPLRLRQGESIEVSVFRLYPDPVQFNLQFKKPRGILRAELGNWHKHDLIGRNIVFDSFGENIKLTVQTDHGEGLYEMRPGDIHGRTDSEKNNSIAIREFNPFVEDNNPASFPNYSIIDLCPVIPSGFSKVKITVTNVGPVTENEDVQLYISPPLEVKTVHTSDYMWLGWLELFLPHAIVFAGIFGWLWVRSAK
jgi:hypothetical protein